MLCYYAAKQNQCTERLWLWIWWRSDSIFIPCAGVSWSLFSLPTNDLLSTQWPSICNVFLHISHWHGFIWKFNEHFMYALRHLRGRIDPELAELLANVRFWSRILLSARLWFVWPFGVWAPSDCKWCANACSGWEWCILHTLAAHVWHCFTKESWFCIELQIHEGMVECTLSWLGILNESFRRVPPKWPG